MARLIKGFDVVDFRPGPLVCQFGEEITSDSPVSGFTEMQLGFFAQHGEKGLAPDVKAVFYIARAEVVNRKQHNGKIAVCVLPYIQITAHEDGSPVIGPGLIAFAWDTKDSDDVASPFVCMLHSPWADLEDLCNEIGQMLTKHKNGRLTQNTPFTD